MAIPTNRGAYPTIGRKLNHAIKTLVKVNLVVLFLVIDDKMKFKMLNGITQNAEVKYANGISPTANPNNTNISERNWIKLSFFIFFSFVCQVILIQQ